MRAWLIVIIILPSPCSIFTINCRAPSTYSLTSDKSHHTGKMNFFEMNTYKVLSEFQAADTTYFEWSPSGDVFLTGQFLLVVTL